MRTAIAVLACVFLVPALLFAQASITGTVKDASGAVLPGVTVEAASPALIEKTRNAVSDSTGQYRIENLRPGIYSVTFTLNGFSTVKREGIELTGSFTATVNVDMKVGGIEETVTVTGESPIVDVQSAVRQSVITKEVINALPTSGGYSSLLVLTPGITTGGTQDVATGPCACTFSAHGAILSGRANSEGRTMLDGLLIAVPQASSSNYLSDTRSAQEVTFTVSGSLGEVETGGPVMNIVPRTGGNNFSGNLYAGVGPTWLQSSNYTQDLKDRGLVAPTPLIKNYDYSGFVGGPFLKDRVWFFTTVRSQGNSQYLSNVWFNKNEGNPNAWLYVPDFNRPAFSDRTYQNISLRVTAQISPRNKVSIFDDEQWICKSCENGGNRGISSPEANSRGDQWPVQVKQFSWTSPVTNKFLIEFGAGQYQAHWGSRQKEDPYTGDLVRIVEQCTAGCPANGNIPSLQYRSQSNDLFINGRNLNQTFMWRAIMSYVTGSRSFKAGYTANLLGDLRSANRAPNSLNYRVNNGVPNQLTEFINNFQNDLYLRMDGFFVQEQWTMKRLTMQGAIRFDHVWSWAPPQQEGPVRFLPTPLVYDKTASVDSYKDINPRAAATYDVFGNGKTALKATFGRYLEATITNGIYGIQNPTSRIISSTTRTWTDSNGNYDPECDLLNSGVQDLRASGGDFCGALANQNFGKSVVTNTIDPAILNGWGVRPSDWDLGVSVQHELLPRVSVDVGYFWRWFQGFVVTDNRAVTAADYTAFSILAPLDPRLPGGGGYSVGPIYDLNPNIPFGTTNNYVTYSNNYGNQYQRFHGLDMSMTARPGNGFTVQGSLSLGRTVADSCEIRAKVPEVAPLDPWCHVETGLLPYVKSLGAYMIPKVDVQFSATFTSKPGLQVSNAGTPTSGGHLFANYTLPNAAIVPIIGRSLAGNTPNITVNIVQPGSLYGDRVNELDVRFAKILKFGKTRANLGVDIYNFLNAAPILAYNQAFIANGAWLTPTQVMTARFAKLSAQFDF
jgi:hypothetical protein